MVVSTWWSVNGGGQQQFMKPCTHIVVGNETILQHQVIKCEGRAIGDSEEPALLRGVQHGAVAVDRDVRAGGDGDLRIVVAGEVGGERHRGRSAARNGLANVNPGARGRVAPAVRASSDLGLACARTKSVAEYLSMAAHKLPVAVEETAANANGTVTRTLMETTQIQGPVMRSRFHTREVPAFWVLVAVARPENQLLAVAWTYRRRYSSTQSQ
jgi:hypothetical protein